MKSLLTATLTLALAGSTLIAEEKKEAAPAAASSDLFKEKYDKSSYAIGMDMGGSVKNIIEEAGVALNPELIAKGLVDTLKGSSALTTEEAGAALQELQKEFQEKRAAQLKEASEKNAAESTKFLEENKKKDGVKTTESGLQYKVLTEGKGDKPSKDDTVVVHYKGTLVDGTEFDSTEKHGGPATFGVGDVIPGWTEALQLMNQGSKYQLVIPSSLAYGENAPPVIGPNQALVFEVELVEIKKGEAESEEGEAKTEEKK